VTEAAVSFVGNLTDDPEVRYTEDGIARAMFRVAVSGRREQEASFFTVIVWRDPGRACQPVALEGQPDRGRGPAPAANLDRRGRQRPIHRRGRGRRAGTKPAVGDRHTKPGDQVELSRPYWLASNAVVRRARSR
jgi:Single-strand binding protein family